MKTGTVKKEGQQSSVRSMGSRRAFIARMRCGKMHLQGSAMQPRFLRTRLVDCTVNIICSSCVCFNILWKNEFKGFSYATEIFKNKVRTFICTHVVGISWQIILYDLYIYIYKYYIFYVCTYIGVAMQTKYSMTR